MALLGTHGTTISRAKEILNSQAFKASNSGHAGSGVYFWAYENEERYGYELAECWWSFATSKQRYLDDAEPSCCVLKVEFSHPGEKKFLDATIQQFQEAVFRALVMQDRSEDDVPEIAAVLIEEMELANGEDFDVIRVRIKTPPVVKKTSQRFAQMVSKMSDAYLMKESGFNLIQKISELNFGGGK